MKLFIYSDVHISRTSSILPLTSDIENQTYRQRMIVNTAHWMAGLVDTLKPDMIINLGDTFDQNTLTSYDIETASMFFKQFNKSIPHFVLCGNHEMLNDNHNAIKLLDNIEGIHVIDSVTETDGLLFIPYCDYNNLDLHNYNGNDYLFLHHDVYGSKVSPTQILDFGIPQEELSKFKKVFNGHVHATSKFSNIINVGSITTHSFADSKESLPTCYLFDTETQEITEYTNTYCPLFRKICADNMAQLESELGILDVRFKYVLHIECDFEIKEQVENAIKGLSNLITYKITTKSIKQDEEMQVQDVKIESNLDVMKSFKDFLNTGIELKFPMNLYNDVLKDESENIEQTKTQTNNLF